MEAVAAISTLAIENAPARALRNNYELMAKACPYSVYED